MSRSSTSSLQPLIDRMRSGDLTARSEFLGHVEGRVHILARKILNAKWSRLRRVTDSQSVAQRALSSLLSQKELKTPSFDDFMKYCVGAIRNKLCDIAEDMQQCPGDYGKGDGGETQSQSALEYVIDDEPGPSRKAESMDLLEAIERLPPELKVIVEYHGELELPQAEVAKLLRLHPREVSRRWKEASDILRGIHRPRKRKIREGGVDAP